MRLFVIKSFFSISHADTCLIFLLLIFKEKLKFIVQIIHIDNLFFFFSEYRDYTTMLTLIMQIIGFSPVQSLILQTSLCKVPLFKVCCVSRKQISWESGRISLISIWHFLFLFLVSCVKHISPTLCVCLCLCVCVNLTVFIV